MSVSIVELIQAAIENRILDIETCSIGSVHAYDASTQTAQIQLAVKQPIQDELGNLKFVEYPILQDVPILFQRAGSYSITFPIVPSDTVIVLFCKLDSSKWRDTGLIPVMTPLVKPHSLSYAFAMPMVAPNSVTLTGAVEQAMVISGDEIRIGAATAAEVDNVALGTAVKLDNQTMFDAINGAATGSNDGGALFKTNIILALTTAGYPHDVGSPNVKAKK